MGRRVCPARAPSCARGRQPLPQCTNMQHVNAKHFPTVSSTNTNTLQHPAGVLVAPAGVRTSTPSGPDSSRLDVKVVDRRDETTAAAAAASSGGERSSSDTEEALQAPSGTGLCPRDESILSHIHPHFLLLTMYFLCLHFLHLLCCQKNQQQHCANFVPADKMIDSLLKPLQSRQDVGHFLRSATNCSAHLKKQNISDSTVYVYPLC